MKTTSFRCCWFWPFWLMGSLCAQSQSLETVEKSAGDWLRVRAETARLETEWSTQKQLLESIVQAVGERAKSLEAQRDYLKAKTQKERDDRAGAESANQVSTASLKAVEEQLKATDARLLTLRRSLPPRLSSALELPYRSLAQSEIAVGERMQLTMSILNRCLQFNRGITSEEEVLNVSGDGTQRLMEVIYWGLSHGYALDRSAGKVWYGSPGPDGWRWEPVPDAANRVTKVLAIYRGKDDPEFVELPATQRNSPGNATRR